MTPVRENSGRYITFRRFRGKVVLTGANYEAFSERIRKGLLGPGSDVPRF